MAENFLGLDVRTAFRHLQIGASDVGRGDFHQYVHRMLDLRVRYFLHTDISEPVAHKGFRGVSLTPIGRTGVL